MDKKQRRFFGGMILGGSIVSSIVWLVAIKLYPSTPATGWGIIILGVGLVGIGFLVSSIRGK